MILKLVKVYRLDIAKLTQITLGENDVSRK